MNRAVCNVNRAVCNVNRAVCNVNRAVCNANRTVCNVNRTVCKFCFIIISISHTSTLLRKNVFKLGSRDFETVCLLKFYQMVMMVSLSF